MAKKEENKNVLENQEALQEKVVGFEHWIESNSKVVFGLVGVAVLAVAGYFGFSYYKDNQNDTSVLQYTTNSAFYLFVLNRIPSIFLLLYHKGLLNSAASAELLSN